MPGYLSWTRTGTLLNLRTKRFQLCGYALVPQLDKNRHFVKPQDQEISAVWLRPGYSAGKEKKKGSLLNLRTKRFQLCGYTLVTQLEKTNRLFVKPQDQEISDATTFTQSIWSQR